MKIQSKITLVFSLVAALILWALYSYLDLHLKNHYYDQITTSLRNELSLSRSYIEQSALGLSTESMDALAERIGQDLNIRATIIGAQGTVLGDSEITTSQIKDVENHLSREEVQQALAQGFGQSRRYSATIRKELLYMASTFSIHGEKGIIRLAMPLSRIEYLSAQLKGLLGVSLFIAFGLAVILNLLIAHLITRPVRDMSHIAKRIAQGQLDEKVLISSKDEIGELSRAINEMTRQNLLRIQELDLSRSRLEAVLLSMFEGVMVLDAEGKIFLINKPLKDFLGIEQDVRDRRPIEVIRNVEVQELAEMVFGIQAGIKSREITVYMPEEKSLLVYAASVMRDNKNDGAILVFHDITDLRRLERVRQDFVANVSHELRTPLSSIKGYAETLLEGALKDEEHAEEFLQIIVDESNRLSQLIQDLLSLSKIESGKISFHRESCSLENIVKKVAASFQKALEEKKITIEIDFEPDLPLVIADEAGISQVLLNLIDNAIKYNRENGQIKIRAFLENGFVQVAVSDTGIGIPAEDLSRIFERFYRVDKARSRDLGGTGLGLSIVKNIIQAHQGEVFVQSTPMSGSIFSFTLPKAS